MIPYDEFRRSVRERKRRLWGAILAAEPEGRPAGRRPRDPEQEALLVENDRRRLAQSRWLRNARRVPVDLDPTDETQ